MMRTALAAWVGIGLLLAPVLCLAKPPAWSCDDNAELHLGGLVLFNYVWNKGTIHDYEQCIAGDDELLRWRWRWPEGDLMPEAYPEVVFGHHPWRPESTTPELPQRVKDLKKLRATYRAKLEGSGVYNLAFQLWFVDHLPATPDAAQAEVMVWVANRGMRPAGRQTAHIVHGDHEYEVFESDRRHLDRGEWREWHLITLVSRVEQLVGPLDVRPLLEKLRDRGQLGPDLWLANVDLGTEVAAGSGSAELIGYSIELR